MKMNGGLGWVLLVVLTMGIVASLLSVPVWMQNRYLRLMKEQSLLERDRRLLEAEQLQLRLEIGTLSSMERLVKIAAGMGLSFGSMPVKVMEIPASRPIAGEP